MFRKVILMILLVFSAQASFGSKKSSSTSCTFIVQEELKVSELNINTGAEIENDIESSTSFWASVGHCEENTDKSFILLSLDTKFRDHYIVTIGYLNSNGVPTAFIASDYKFNHLRSNTNTPKTFPLESEFRNENPLDFLTKDHPLSVTLQFTAKTPKSELGQTQYMKIFKRYKVEFNSQLTPQSSK